jgi:hypothetical protein
VGNNRWQTFIVALFGAAVGAALVVALLTFAGVGVVPPFLGQPTTPTAAPAMVVSTHTFGGSIPAPTSSVPSTRNLSLAYLEPESAALSACVGAGRSPRT